MPDPKHQNRQQFLRACPEQSWHVITSFIEENAETARLLKCVISCHGGPTVTASREAKELAEQLTAKISKSFLDWFGHELIAPEEAERGRM